MDIVQYVLQTEQLRLEVAHFIFQVPIDFHFADHHIVNMGAVEVGGDETANLREDGHEANRVKNVELIEGVQLFMDDE
jgi:hypothetical protein